MRPVVMTAPTKGLSAVGMEVGGVDMEEEVKEAYEVMKRIDVLDVSVGKRDHLSYAFDRPLISSNRG